MAVTEYAAPTGETSPPHEILSLRGVSKAFGHIQALTGVDLDLHAGEILGVVGDNGAGKSTLMKIIAGNLRADSGEIWVDGQMRSIENAQDARRLGIELVYQDLALFNNLTIAENIYIGREPTSAPLGLLAWLRRDRMQQQAAGIFRRLGVKNISSTNLKVDALSGGQRQIVAIARAVAFESRITILDEPSAALGAAESAIVLKLVRSLRDHGVSIIVISHRIPELLGLADRVLVMKGGQRVAVVDAATTTVDDCVNLIVSGLPSEPRRAVATSGQTPPSAPPL